MLPQLADLSSYRPFFAQDECWHAAMNLIGKRHGIDPHSLKRHREGSAIVFGNPQLVIKLLPPFWQHEADLDRLGLSQAKQHLDLALPRLEAEGTLESPNGDWHYLIMSRIPGQQAKYIWPHLDLSQQASILFQMGELLCAWHQLDASVFPGDWPHFLKHQPTRFAEQQRQYGMPEIEITSYLRYLEQALPADPIVPLYADLTRDHLFLEERQGQWKISGLIDFGDIMRGWWGYEMAAPCLCYTEHQPSLRQALWQGYGKRLEPESVLIAILLHRFTHLPYLLRQVGLEPGAPVSEFIKVYCS